MINQIVPPALKFWLLFLLIFLVLGYGVVASIGFGAIAGLATGILRTWWITPGGEPTNLELPAPIRQFSRQLRQTPSRFPTLFKGPERRYPGPRR